MHRTNIQHLAKSGFPRAQVIANKISQQTIFKFNFNIKSNEIKIELEIYVSLGLYFYLQNLRLFALLENVNDLMIHVCKPIK